LVEKHKEFQALLIQPQPGSYPGSQAATASQRGSDRRPASHSQPASQRPKSALDQIQHQIAPKATKSTTFAYAFFQAFNSRKQLAGRPASEPGNPIPI